MKKEKKDEKDIITFSCFYVGSDHRIVIYRV